MAKSAKKDEKKILLRIPTRLAKKVGDRATANERSLNGQIVYELNQNQ